jgi:hypothetical protein
MFLQRRSKNPSLESEVFSVVSTSRVVLLIVSLRCTCQSFLFITIALHSPMDLSTNFLVRKYRFNSFCSDVVLRICKVLLQLYPQLLTVSPKVNTPAVCDHVFFNAYKHKLKRESPFVYRFYFCRLSIYH